jgi:hypothetical protein
LLNTISEESNVNNIMVIGAGDLGVRVADALIRREKVGELTLVDLPGGGGAKAAEWMAACNTIPIHFEGINCLDTSAVEDGLRRRKPDLIVFGASLRTSETVMRSEDPRGKAMWSAGMGVQIPFQIPILLSVMRAVKSVAPDTPVANATVPDVCHRILHAGGLAPTAGYGNPGIMHLRIRANMVRAGTPAVDLPEIRIIGGFAYVIPVMFGMNPGDVSKEPMVFLGNDGTRATSDILYAGEDLLNILPVNYATALAGLPVIEALLPGGKDCQTNSPGPLGLFGGYPVKIVNQKIEMDLPSEVTLEEAIAFNESGMPGIGVERFDDDGTIHYTDAAKAAMADVDPRLTEPYNALTDRERTTILLDQMNSWKK